MIHVRCSSLPLVQVCPASAKPAQIKISRQNKAADLGSAVHDDEVMAAVVDGVQVDLNEVAARYDVPVAQLAGLFAVAKRMWSRIGQFFLNPKREGELSTQDGDILLTGHMDIRGVSPDGYVTVADWKSGRLDEDATFQLMGYLFLALRNSQQYDKGYVVSIRLRSEETVGGRIYSRKDLEAWWAKLCSRILAEEYNPGESWCWKCQRFAECPAKNAILANAHNAMVKGTGGFPADPVAKQEAIGKLYDQMRLARKFLDDLGEMIQAEVHAAGALPIGHDRELYLKEVDKTEILFKEGESVLREWLGGRIHEALAVEKGKAVGIVSDAAGKSQKKHAIRDFMEALEGAKAIKKSKSIRVESRRVDKQIESKGD